MTADNTFKFNGIEYIKVKKYFSRLNSVFLIESLNDKKEKFILKDFENNSDMINAELNGMKIFENFSPKVYFSDQRYLVHEYIPGNTFLSSYEEAEKTDSDPELMINSFVEFLKTAYESAPGYILGDINFNNFIIRESKPEISRTLPISFIDYENVKPGEIEEDLGRMMAFALTYDPVFTDWKFGFVAEFIERAVKFLKADKAKMLFYAEKEFEAMNVRRRLEIDIPEVLIKVK